MRKYDSNIFGMMRVENIDNEPWFCAVDICREIGLKKASIYVRRYVGESHIQKVQEGFHEVLMVDTFGAAHLIEMGHLADEDKAMAEDEIERIWLEASRDMLAENEQKKQEPETEQKCCERNKIDANAKLNFEEEEQMQGMQIFTNAEFGDIRTEIINGEPWFCLKDVCKALEIANAVNVKNRLTPKGVRTMDTLTAGGKQGLTFVNEANLYKTIFQSRKESAAVTSKA